MSQQNDQKTELEQPEWLKNHVPKPPKIGNPNWHKGMKSPKSTLNNAFQAAAL